MALLYRTRSHAHPTSYHDAERSRPEWHLRLAHRAHRELVGTAQYAHRPVQRRFCGCSLLPLGAYMVGFTALTAAVAFPLDAYWHALYGIDVAIWAPFHVMFVASMGLVALGAAYMLSSAAHLAARLGTAGSGTRRAASLGVVLALATVLSLFTLLLFDALADKNFINLGFMSFDVFPLLSGLLVAFTLVAAAYAIPWRWAATAVSVCYLVLAGIMALFVQPATDWLLTVERLNYRGGSCLYLGRSA